MAYAVVGVAGALAFTVAACGDDDEQAKGGLDKAQLVSQANAICKPHFEKITAEAQKMLAGGNLPSERQFAKLAMGTIIPQYSAQIAQLRDLEPADEIEARWNAWLATSDRTLAKVKKSPPLLMRASSFKTVNGQADALGLSEQCHVGPGS
jgi:hypothetical protein